ncbi:MAG TPA: ATP-binding protein, partial [Candidatus Dormibacteraeota bacterium]|nr:ATP-binding protein [Candidatus Dormibacteraeota bacterium]
MNTRSLKFRLIVWYTGFLAGCFILLGMAAYFALQSYLVGALKGTVGRRARQIAQLVSDREQQGKIGEVGTEVDARYAPQLNDRFVRVSRSDGNVIYVSSAPASSSFMPEALPRSAWPAKGEKSERLKLGSGHEMLVAARTVEVPGHGKFLVEAGALMDDVQDALRQWLWFLVGGLPGVALLAIGGGYLLVRRALAPVDQIAASAERISSQSLSERLPVPQTGDELERLSVALNHMIERLDQALQHSRRFVADASHELRTPLTVLRGEIESFVQESRLAPEWREGLGSALEELERLVNIVEGLFAISRLDAGEAQAESVPFNLSQLITGTAEQMGLLAEDKKIKVTCNGAANVWVQGDRSRMKQVVVNLLDNAIKYTPAEGAVSLSVTASGGMAVLEVADNGIGIPKPSLPKVFERFYRVDEARSREQGGAGLGLSIVRSICAAHNGRVEALSTPGQGSIFRVELPLVTG